MSWNMPAGASENDDYFTDESGDVCEHSSPICAKCEEEDAKAKAAETKHNHTIGDLFTIEISNGKAWLGYGSIIILAAVFVLAYELFNWLFR